MATFTWKNNKDLEAFAKELGYLAKNQALFGKAVYAMADIVADAVRENIDGLRAVPDEVGLKRWKAGKKKILLESEKKGLQEGFGISPMQRTDGYYNVKLGFDGYDSMETNEYPNGHPIVMIARSLESGTSFMEKQPFVRDAVNRSRKPAIKKCGEIVDQEIKKQMDGG